MYKLIKPILFVCVVCFCSCATSKNENKATYLKIPNTAIVERKPIDNGKAKFEYILNNKLLGYGSNGINSLFDQLEGRKFERVIFIHSNLDDFQKQRLKINKPKNIEDIEFLRKINESGKHFRIFYFSDKAFSPLKKIEVITINRNFQLFNKGKLVGQGEKTLEEIVESALKKNFNIFIAQNYVGNGLRYSVEPGKTVRTILRKYKNKICLLPNCELATELDKIEGQNK